MKKATKSNFMTADVTFELPDWFPPERLEKRGGKNSAEEALFRLGIHEISSHGYCVVNFECSLEALPTLIRLFDEKLTRFLNRYKESRYGQNKT